MVYIILLHNFEYYIQVFLKSRPVFDFWPKFNLKCLVLQISIVLFCNIFFINLKFNLSAQKNVQIVKIESVDMKLLVNGGLPWCLFNFCYFRLFRVYSTPVKKVVPIIHSLVTE